MYRQGWGSYFENVTALPLQGHTNTHIYWQTVFERQYESNGVTFLPNPGGASSLQDTCRDDLSTRKSNMKYTPKHLQVLDSRLFLLLSLKMLMILWQVVVNRPTRVSLWRRCVCALQYMCTFELVNIIAFSSFRGGMRNSKFPLDSTIAVHYIRPFSFPACGLIFVPSISALRRKYRDYTLWPLWLTISSCLCLTS